MTTGRINQDCSSISSLIIMTAGDAEDVSCGLSYDLMIIIVTDIITFFVIVLMFFIYVSKVTFDPVGDAADA